MAAMGLRRAFGFQPINILFVLCFIRNVYMSMDMEELKSIYYGLDILNEPVTINQETSGGSVQVTSKYGQQYQCTFPDHSELEKKKEEEEKVAVETGIVEMLKSMKTQDCLVKTKDWWSYEFCYGKSVRQFHMEDGSIKGNIIHLGFYDSDFDWSNETAKEERLKMTLASYHSQLYNQGDKCDLTGKPRQVEVRFMCEENSEDYLSRIEESETCVYTMTVITSRICRHPYLRPPVRRKAVPITCNPLLSEDEYHHYKAEVNELKEADRKYREEQRQKKEEDLKKRKYTMDKDLEESLLKTARDVLSEPKGSLFPEPGEDGKVSKESFMKMFGSSEQLWELYQKGLELSKKSVEERKKKLEELKELQKKGRKEEQVDSEDDKEDEEILSEYSNEIDEIKKRFSRTQKKLSNIKQKLAAEKKWEDNIEEVIKEAEKEHGIKLDRSLVAGLSSTLNKLVNKLEDTENELSSMDKEINGLKPGDKVINSDETGVNSDEGEKGESTGKSYKHATVEDDDDDEDKEKNKKKVESNPVLKGDGVDQNPDDKWRLEKPQDPTPSKQQQQPFGDKIKSPPRSSDDENMDYSDKKLEVPSTFPLPKDPTQDVVDPDYTKTAPPGGDTVGDEGREQGVESKAERDFKMSIEELEDTDEENKIPSNIKEMLEETVMKELEKKLVKKNPSKLGLDADHSYIQDKSIHVIQQEDKDGNTNRFIFVLGFKNLDEEAAEQDRQSVLEENYEFVYNKRKLGGGRGGGDGGEGGSQVKDVLDEGDGGADGEGEGLEQPVR